MENQLPYCIKNRESYSKQSWGRNKEKASVENLTYAKQFNYTTHKTVSEEVSVFSIFDIWFFCLTHLGQPPDLKTDDNFVDFPKASIIIISLWQLRSYYFYA